MQNGWKPEIDLGSLFESRTPSELDKIVDEYCNIKDKGIVLTETDSNQSYNSYLRKKKFHKAMKKPRPQRVRDDYSKAIYQVQKAYI